MELIMIKNKPIMKLTKKNLTLRSDVKSGHQTFQLQLIQHKIFLHM